MTMFKIIDFRALTAILLFLMALLFSLPNLVIAMVLMLVISALLEAIRFLTDYNLWYRQREEPDSLQPLHRVSWTEECEYRYRGLSPLLIASHYERRSEQGDE